MMSSNSAGFLKWNDSLYEPYAKEDITDWIKEQLKKESEQMEYRTYYTTTNTSSHKPLKRRSNVAKKIEADYDAENKQLDDFLQSFSRKDKTDG